MFQHSWHNQVNTDQHIRILCFHFGPGHSYNVIFDIPQRQKPDYISFTCSPLWTAMVTQFSMCSLYSCSVRRTPITMRRPIRLDWISSTAILIHRIFKHVGAGNTRHSFVVAKCRTVVLVVVGHVIIISWMSLVIFTFSKSSFNTVCFKWQFVGGVK